MMVANFVTVVARERKVRDTMFCHHPLSHHVYDNKFETYRPYSLSEV